MRTCTQCGTARDDEHLWLTGRRLGTVFCSIRCREEWNAANPKADKEADVPELSRRQAAVMVAEALAEAVGQGDLARNQAAHLVTELAGRLAGEDAEDAQEIIEAALEAHQATT